MFTTNNTCVLSNPFFPAKLCANHVFVINCVLLLIIILIIMMKLLFCMTIFIHYTTEDVMYMILNISFVLLHVCIQQPIKFVQSYIISVVS